jgi:hypothetical protein
MVKTAVLDAWMTAAQLQACTACRQAVWLQVAAYKQRNEHNQHQLQQQLQQRQQ